MHKRDKPNDGLVPKLVISAIVVIWISLVGGNWLGHFAVEKGLLGKSTKTEYRAMPAQKPKPWVTVDPKQVEVVERLSGNPQSVPISTPSASATPEEEEGNPGDIITATPIVPSGEAKPLEPTPTPAGAVATPDPTPTAAAGDDRWLLQFGSFSSEENARKFAEQLKGMGQDARVEEIDAGNEKVYRVRGGSFSEEEARQQRDKLREQNIDAYPVRE